MIALKVRHRTIYRYGKPVSLQPHSMLLRPREGRDLRLLSHRLEVSPSAQLAWARDVAGNEIATAVFHAPAAELVIDSTAEVELTTDHASYQAASTAAFYPFRYGDDERGDLGNLAELRYYDPDGQLFRWTRDFMRSEPTDTLALLRDINAGIAAWVFYQSREDEGTQGPLETLGRGWGSCRDLAVLFAEAVRTLGFGARIVSGYIYLPEGPPGPGATHAWVEVFVPGAGWIPFDPTHGSMGGRNLVPVAVGRHILQVVPVAGSFIGMTDAYLGMTVEVFVTACEDAFPAL